MISNQASRPYHCLNVETTVDALSAGGTATHHVTVRNYAIKQITVGFASECSRGIWGYGQSPRWSPQSVEMPPAGIGRRKRSEWPFQTDLYATTADSGQHELVVISPWRKAPQAPVEQLRAFPMSVRVT